MTREESLNNPCGLVHTADKWIGMSADQPDHKFVKFTEPFYGLRAAARNIRSQQREGITTLAQLTVKLSPASDSNDPVEYAQFLADQCQWHPTIPVVFDSLQPALLKAFVTRENGRCIYSDSLIELAIKGTPPMSTPEPLPSPPSALASMLRPSASKSAGALVGGYMATLVVAAANHYLGVTLGPGEITAISGLCIFVVSHIVKD